MLNKPKEKTIGTYLKLVDFLVEPVILYACEPWGNSQKWLLQIKLTNSICQCISKYCLLKMY